MNSPEGSNFEGCGFKVGDTVVCVELDQSELKRNNLSYGQQYVVKVVEEDFTSPEDSILRLEGREGWGQGVFAYRFKKVETTGEITMEHTAERIREDILHIEKRIEEAKKDIASMEQEKNALIEKLKEKGFILLSDNQSTQAYVRPSVGDLVRVIRVDEDYDETIYLGYEFVIKKDDGTNLPYMDNHYNWFREDSVVKI